MKVFCGALVVVNAVLIFDVANSFAPSSLFKKQQLLVYQRQTKQRHWTTSSADTSETEASQNNNKPKTQQLGLLTFDLDDTLYPIAPVVEEANAGFVRAMERYGFEGVSSSDIVETGRAIREEIGETDPQKAATLTHTEVRELAIRREIEKIILDRKLQATAEDWATQVGSLSPIVVNHAKKWAKNAVSESVVQAVLSAWEMERHHGAERHLYPEVVDALKQIKQDHPGVIIGAVTDGKANPLLMTFTLAPYFDFCVSWEDDQGARKQFFTDLADVGANAELTWIYDAARHKYATLKFEQDSMNAAAAAAGQKTETVKPLVFPETYDDLVWIHVGDDLAFDVGGSAACGAKTILVELASKYGQTANKRFDPNVQQPAWSTTPTNELEARIQMNEAAKDMVNVKINTLERLPVAINEILRGDA